MPERWRGALVRLCLTAAALFSSWRFLSLSVIPSVIAPASLGIPVAWRSVTVSRGHA